MSSDNETIKSLMKEAIQSHVTDLFKSLDVGPKPKPTERPSPANDDPEANLSAEDKAKKEEKAFDSPTDDEHEELQGLAYWSLEHRRRIDSLTIQKTQEEIVRISCENDDLRAKTKNNHAVARGRQIDNRLRLQLAAATFKFMQYWCGFVAFIVAWYVFAHYGKPEKEVIIALLGTSTISIIGLVGFVVSGLFKSKKDE